MAKLSQKILIGITAVYFISFIAFFIFSVLNFAGVNIIGQKLTNPKVHDLNIELSTIKNKPASEIQILSNFKISWILTNSFRLLVEHLLVIQSMAIIIIFSLLIPWKLGPQGMQTPFVDVIGKSIFIFLILTLLYTGLFEGLLPGILKKQSDQENLTTIAIDYFEKAKTEISSSHIDRNYGEIVNMLKAYLQIDPENIVIESALDWAEGELTVKGATDNDSIDQELLTEKKGKEAAELIKKATDYYNSEDYFSSLYYANLAFKLDDSRQEAQRIAAESREAIRSLEPDQSEREAKMYFDLKRTGFNTLNEGNPIDAYYIFKELSNISNSDKDIPEFLDRSLKEISNISFFIDEVENYDSLPGIEKLTFLSNRQLLVTIGKMIPLDNNEAFFIDMEVIKFETGMKIKSHFTTKYGKYDSASKSIIMNAIDRENSNSNYKPRYIIGENIKPDKNILKIEPNLTELRYLGQNSSNIKFMNILELFKYAPVFEKYGYIKEPVYIVILQRIIQPFTFLVVSFLSVSLGWFLRIRKYKFPFIAILLTPLVAYLIHNILSIYQFGMDLILAWALFKTGFYPALVILIVSQAIILFISLITIASQKE
jgi:hypothetical protein